MVGAEGGRLNRYPTLAGHRWDRLIEQGQVVVGYVRNLEPRVLTFGGEAVQPAGDLEGLAGRVLPAMIATCSRSLCSALA